MNTKSDIPIRPSEMGVLVYACKQYGPVTPLMISRFFRIAKPSVTSMVNSLVKNGYLKKESSETDRRSYSLKVTEKGSELVESTFSEYVKSMELLKSGMGDEKFNELIELIQIANVILGDAR
ncbi:MarR family winged helix-turn-helix transcriptional regulator [Youngiibacter fragilis]|nr:MarR family winged helix-turn-helix transcriptional regulator [Youngiibacter fragilis]